MIVLLASPRGFCAGVEMAIECLDKAIRCVGPGIFVYHEIVHNRIVVDRFEKLGVTFVETLDDVPEGSVLVLNQATPDSTIGGEKTKLLLKSGVIESSQAITTDMQKGVSSEQVEDTEVRSQRTPASVKDYTKEARRKQATHR